MISRHALNSLRQLARYDVRSVVPQGGGGLLLASVSRPSLDYYLYVPPGRVASGRVLVSVHGVSRNALEHVELLKTYADAYDVLLVAPMFGVRAYRDYQRLGRKGVGPRADLALIRLLNEIGLQLGVDTGKVDLFGYSGGAQFAHRFAYAHCQRLRGMVLGAAGWYTMPDPFDEYPFGLAAANGLDAVRLDPAALAALPTLVMVGELDDCEDDVELNKSRRVQQVQGRHRVARARHWVEEMGRCAHASGERCAVQLHVLPGVAHSFRQAVQQGGMARRMFEHCYGEASLARSEENAPDLLHRRRASEGAACIAGGVHGDR